MKKPGEIAISLDVEWACAEVVADAIGLLDEHGVRATLFCTHAGIEAPGHERALHPNFERAGNTQIEPGAWLADNELIRAAIGNLQRSYPEAVGARGHRCHTTYHVLKAYRDHGLQYESATVLPLAPALRPAWTMEHLVWLPVYYMDHWDLLSQATSLRISDLKLDAPGLKIFVFHPNLVYLNGATLEEYEASRAFYHNAARLREARNAGRGTRTLFIELLDRVARQPHVRTLAEIQQEFRSECAGSNGNRVQ